MRSIIALLCALSCLAHGFLRTETVSVSTDTCRFEVKSAPLCRSLQIRAGGGSDDEQPRRGNDESAETEKSNQEPQEKPRKRRRHSSDVISNILGGTDPTDDSYNLRQLITTRAQTYMDDLLACGPGDKLPHPRRFLHFIAPKISAIKHSPDIMLRVQCSRTDIDAGVAACAIGSVAQVCESYDKQKRKSGKAHEGKHVFSVGSDIAGDRRFEQLCECVLCGVDTRRRKEEAHEREASAIDGTDEESCDIEQILDDENAKISPGLSVQDACRAAWGIAIVGGYDMESIGGEKTADILTALSLQSRERLLARLQLLRQGEPRKQFEGEKSITLAEQLEKDAQSLARDTASAMWTFACVKACTGIASIPLLETCCSLLCQNPTELREKANAASEGLDGSNFATNDVVERLARSEIDTKTPKPMPTDAVSSSETSSAHEDSVSDVRDSLLDWLSPNEVTDVLWALALHGSPMEVTETNEEHKLTVTAAAFRDIAFDRLIIWLRRDLEKTRRLAGARSPSDLADSESPLAIETQTGFEHVTDVTRGNVQGEEIVVEVVDAAKLLASASDAAKHGIETEVENMTVKSIRKAETASLQVVDAATLLAMAEGGDPGEIETEIIITTSSSIDTNSNGLKEIGIQHEASSTGNDTLSEQSADMSLTQLSFKPHDLCSIAWAVTDLRDPLRFAIVDLVALIFTNLGKESLSDLTGGDLANLAWALSRVASRDSLADFDDSAASPAILVTKWITEIVLERVERDGTNLLESPPKTSDLLEEFQPPEIGRLLWSIAFTMDKVTDPFGLQEQRDLTISKLAEATMHTAGSNIPVFGTEDLVRISWAFLKLCDTKKSMSDPRIAESFGRILSVVEASLLLWESGQTLNTKTHNIDKPDDSVRFSSFFGRSRFALPILNQKIGNFEVDEGEILPYPLSKRASLPLLRDLSIDPSSLCKLAAAYAELGQTSEVKGGWTLIRVAIRLLASKSGQLMKQCTTRDIIRLCYACATNEIHGHGREHVTRLYTRRVLQVLNAAFDDGNEDHISAQGRYSRASPWDKAMLMWSLGELGVRHVSEDDNPGIAHRKLQLVMDQDPLSTDEIESLSVESLSRLLHGAVSMHMLGSNPSFFQSLLSRVEGRVPDIQNGADLCELNFSISKIMSMIGKEDTSRSLSKSKGERSDPVSIRETGTEDNAEEDDSEESRLSLDSEILASCRRLLFAIAERGSELVDRLSAKEMRRLLLIYAVTPFQADAVVNSIEKQVEERLKALSATEKSGVTVDEAVRVAAEGMLRANQRLFDKGGESPVAVIKHGIKSLFRHSENDEEQSGEAEELAKCMHQASASTQLLADKVFQLRKGMGADVEAILQGREQSIVVELGRCLELIQSYRRIDFDTGARQTRYDRTRRRDIGKRVLSRLFPQD